MWITLVALASERLHGVRVLSSAVSWERGMGATAHTVKVKTDMRVRERERGREGGRDQRER